MLRLIAQTVATANRPPTARVLLVSGLLVCQSAVCCPPVKRSSRAAFHHNSQQQERNHTGEEEKRHYAVISAVIVSSTGTVMPKKGMMRLVFRSLLHRCRRKEGAARLHCRK